MNAYHLAMLFILINAGIIVVASVDVFGEDITKGSTILSLFESENPEQDVLNITMGIAIIGGTIIALTIALFLGTTRIPVVNSIFPAPQGWAYVAFTGVFWASFLSAFDIFITIANRVEGFGVFVGVFTVIAVLIFIMALVQLATAGVKSHG